MFLWKKLSLAALLVVLTLLVVAIILIPILTEKVEEGDDSDVDDGNHTEIDICDENEPYVKVALRSGQRSHMEKLKIGLPPVQIPRNRALFPDWGWITQRVDHFNPTDLRTWDMRYLNNSEFYEEGGPMFIFLGGEWAISASYLMTGQMFDMANETNGYMFYTEHRYYGSSFPTENLCTHNMQYANADQALADIAYFIEYQKSVIPGIENSKVVVVGGSYSAMLATWMRMKYPHLVDAALSSSAPLRAVADFYEYYEVVSDNLKLASEECVDIISEAMLDVESFLGDESTVSKVLDAFDILCNNGINTTEPHKTYFFTALAVPFASIVQYANVGQLDEVCIQLQSYDGSSFDKFAAYIRDYYEGYCITDYNYYVNYLRNPLITSTISRQWIYQTCTEYGFYQTSASSNQPFRNFELSYYINLCQDVFDFTEEVLNTGIERTNLLYGSVYPEVTKVVSVHGTVDPWHPLGVLEDINSEAPVFVVEGTSHCADLSSISDNDLEQMREVKAKVKSLIIEWIS